MMTASETDTEDFDIKSSNDNSAILEVSTISTGTIPKQEFRDPDYISNSNYSTSVEGSVVSLNFNLLIHF